MWEGLHKRIPLKSTSDFGSDDRDANEDDEDKEITTSLTMVKIRYWFGQ